jgi:hypothetical protein
MCGATDGMTSSLLTVGGDGSLRVVVLGRRLFLGRSWCDSVARQHASWVNRGQQMKAIIPAQAVREAGGGDAVEPARTDTFVVAHCHAHTVEQFIGLASTAQACNQCLADRDNRVVGGAPRASELRAIGQVWEGRAQGALSKASKHPLAGKAFRLRKHGQGHDFTLAELALRPGMTRTKWQVLDSIVDKHVHCGQKGVQIQHGYVPFFVQRRHNYAGIVRAPFSFRHSF